MADYKDQGKSYVFASLSSGFAVAATLASGILLARLLSVEDRGLVAVVIYWASFVATIGTFSLNEALIMRVREAGDEISEKLPSALLLSGLSVLGFSLITIAGVYIFSDQFGELDIRIVLGFMLAFLFVRSLNMMLIAVERSSLRFGRLALENALLPLLYSGMLILAGFTGNMTVIVVLAIFLLSRTPILLVRFWRFKGLLFGPVSTAEMKEIGRIGVRFQGTAFVAALSNQADKIVVSVQWSITAIANFAVAFSAAGAAYALVAQALGMIALPVTSKVPDDEMAGHFARSIRVTSILLVSVMIPVVLTAPILVPLVFGSNYEGAVIYTQVLAVSLLPVPVLRLTDTMLRARDHVGQAMQLHLVALVFFGIGWIATGYSEIIALGLGLALSRLGALVVTIIRLEGELATVRLRDCFLWRAEDFTLIFKTAHGLIPARLRKGG